MVKRMITSDNTICLPCRITRNPTFSNTRATSCALIHGNFDISDGNRFFDDRKHRRLVSFGIKPLANGLADVGQRFFPAFALRMTAAQPGKRTVCRLRRNPAMAGGKEAGQVCINCDRQQHNERPAVFTSPSARPQYYITEVCTFPRPISKCPVFGMQGHYWTLGLHIARGIPLCYCNCRGRKALPAFYESCMFLCSPRCFHIMVILLRLL